MMDPGFRIFRDGEQRPVVKLSPDLIAYTPQQGRARHLSLQDVGWVSSKELDVQLHAPDGRVLDTVSWFEEIEEFRKALLGEPTSHREGARGRSI